MTTWGLMDWDNTSIKFFTRRELACPCCGRADMEADFMRRLENLRIAARGAMIITSGFRCQAHNEAVGGAENSYHLKGRAADVKVPNSAVRYRLLALATDFYKPDRLFQGVGIASNFIHLDTRPEFTCWTYG